MIVSGYTKVLVERITISNLVIIKKEGICKLNYFILIALNLLLFFSACDAGDLIPEFGSPISEITLADAESQDYSDLTTPLYGIQVSIRGDVGGNEGNILETLDEMATNFLECQFGDSSIGFDEFQMVMPLSELRVFVVPFTFECEAIDRDTCDGLYFFDSDIIVIAREIRGICDDFAFWKHELGHRYGMAGDHSNLGDFEACIDPPGCIDLPFGIGD